MDECDKKLNELVDERMLIQEGFDRCKDTKKQCGQEMSIASKYIGEIDAQIKSELKDNGIISTETGKYKITLRKSMPSILIEDVDALPDAFVTITRTPNKPAIKEALDNGIFVEGAYVIYGDESILIKRKES